MNEVRKSARLTSVIYGVTVGASAFSLLRGQLAWLRERGWEVGLAASPDDFAARAAAREGVSFHPIMMHRSISLLADLKSLIAWIYLLSRSRPDVVNVGTPKAGLLGSMAAFLCRVPRRVYVLRGLRLEGSKGPTALILWVMEWVTMRASTDVVVVSRSLGVEARRRKLLPKRRCWLVGEGSSNGVPSSEIMTRMQEVSRHELRYSLGIKDDEFVVGYVGRITRDKGIDVLIRALVDVVDPKVRLLLVGSPEGADAERWLTLLGERGVHVDWTDDVWRLYAAMDVFCLPTRREGFPNTVLEASAAGIPTITTDATGAIDSVSDNVTGRVVPVDDASALTNVIRELSTQRDETIQLGVAAKARVVDAFRPEDVWEGIESILRGSPLPHVQEI